MPRKKYTKVAKGKKFLRKARRNIGAAWREIEEMRLILKKQRKK